jgi:hypothetical protein
VVVDKLLFLEMWRFCEVYDDFYGGFLSEDGGIHSGVVVRNPSGVGGALWTSDKTTTT